MSTQTVEPTDQPTGIRAIVFESAEIGSIRTRRDNGVTMSITTGELTVEQTAALLRLKNINVKLLIESIDNPDLQAPVEVKSEREVKGLSQRLYDVMFVWWKQLESPGGFEDFRKAQMEKIINWVKSKLDPF